MNEPDSYRRTALRGAAGCLVLLGLCGVVVLDRIDQRWLLVWLGADAVAAIPLSTLLLTRMRSASQAGPSTAPVIATSTLVGVGGLARLRRDTVFVSSFVAIMAWPLLAGLIASVADLVLGPHHTDDVRPASSV